MNIELRLSVPRLTYVFPFYEHLYEIINIVNCIVAAKHKLVPGSTLCITKFTHNFLKIENSIITTTHHKNKILDGK